MPTGKIRSRGWKFEPMAALRFHKKKSAYLKYANSPSEAARDMATHALRCAFVASGCVIISDNSQSTREVAASITTKRPLLL